jgi:outer membrane protein assembly factor BamA
MRFRRLEPPCAFIVLLVCCLFSLPLFAQAPAQMSLTAIHFTGLERYTAQQATLASRLQAGSTVSIAQLQAASDRLAQTGAFDKVSFEYTTHGSEIAVDFQLTETKSVVPCFFENFVWFSTDELDRTLRARVPLYDGTIPQRGTTTREAADALQAMLHANGINGTVDGLPTVAGTKLVNYAYRVSGVELPVRSIHIPGASSISEAELVGAAKDLMDKDYSATDADYVASLTLLAIYHRRGYLQARFAPPQPTVAATKGSEYDIALTLPVTEGVQFSWNRAAWSGNQKLSADQLTAILGMKPSEVANQDKINAGLKAILTAYSKQGYIDAAMKTNATLDPGARLVAYDSALDEGIQYKMGQLHITGPSDKTVAELLKKWPIKPGEIFDATYPAEFLQKVAIPKISQPGKAPTVEEHLQRDKENATVDLTLAFR